MPKKQTLKVTKVGNLTLLRSPGYNYNYNRDSGEFARWGKTLEDDPTSAPVPEILDIEITTACNGPADKLCGFCYKSNNPNGYNMPFEHFKSIIDKMPWLTQCALGADAQGTSNPDMFKMMEYARSKGIVPNLTIADVSEEVAAKITSVAGAVAVSVYKHAGFDVAFDSVERLAKAGMKHINLHYMISNRTLDDAYKVIDSIKSDPRLKSVNAIVFLSLKQKGRGTKYDYISQEQYADLVGYCRKNKVAFGFDSCSAPSYVESIKDLPNAKQLIMYAEDCESTLFSSYINEKGEFYPCSFTENWTEGGWTEGIDVLSVEDFVRDVWKHPKTVAFREALIANTDGNGCRNCPAFAVCGKDMRIHKPEVIVQSAV